MAFAPLPIDLTAEGWHVGNHAEEGAGLNGDFLRIVNYRIRSNLPKLIVHRLAMFVGPSVIGGMIVQHDGQNQGDRSHTSEPGRNK